MMSIFMAPAMATATIALGAVMDMGVEMVIPTVTVMVGVMGTPSSSTTTLEVINIRT